VNEDLTGLGTPRSAQLEIDMARLSHLRSIASRFLACGAMVLAGVSCGPEVDFPHAPVPEAPPSTAVPPYAAFLRGQRDTLTLQATDANGDPVLSVLADLSELPPGNDAIFSTTPMAGASGSLEGRLLWTAMASDTGLHRVSFVAVNALTGPPDTTLLYTVNHAVDIDPVVTCPDTVHVTVGVPQTIAITAADPDGDPIFELLPTDPLDARPILSFNRLSWTRTLNGSTAAGTLQVRANVTGWFPVRFQAINAAHGFATTMVVAP